MAKALILGSTGLTGKYLLAEILEEDFFTEATIWVRGPIDLKHPKLKVEIVDFNQLPDSDADIVFSCLGTTKKKTPDPEIYRNIEVGIPVSAAKMLSKNKLKQFHYISSLGAGKKSKGSYLKNKTEAENQLRDLQLPTLMIYRPSLIYGERSEKRALEDFSNYIMQKVEPLLKGKIRKYRRIHAQTIAKAMIRNAKSAHPGNFVYESDLIQKIGG